MPVYTQIPLLTIEDYLALPETGQRYQLIEGDLYMAPAPNRFHQDISRNLPLERISASIAQRYAEVRKWMDL